MKPSETPIEEGFDLVDASNMAGKGVKVYYAGERLGTFYDGAKDPVMNSEDCLELGKHIDNTMQRYICQSFVRRKIMQSIVDEDRFPSENYIEKLRLKDVLK